MRIAITGATGLIGRRLARDLDPKDLTVLTRDASVARKSVAAGRYVTWDGVSDLEPSVFEGVDVVYHLAGEPVASGRWTAAKKVRILESRELGTRAVVDAMARSGSKATLVSASAVGFYGSRGDERLTEESAPGEGFLPEVCRTWETEAAKAARHGSRVAMVRIGIVLAAEGGALSKMLPLFRLGLAGRLGSGDQWMPWIHIDDVVGLLRRAAEDGKIEGPLNAAAPQVVTNAGFTRALASALGRPAFLPAPSFALRVAMGELAEVVLASQRVIPEKALRVGYSFRHPDLGEALASIVDAEPLERREVAA